MRWRGVCVVAILFVTLPRDHLVLQTLTGHLTLSWDAATDAGLTVGYRVGYGTASHVYSTQIDVGNVTEYPVYGLTFGQEYYFAVRAYTATGVLSEYSDEVHGSVSQTPAPLTVGLSTSFAPPQPAGTAIAWTALAAGGTPPYRYRWGVRLGSAWTTLTMWSGKSTLNWRPKAPGDYVVQVWVRTTPGEPEATISVPFVITAASRGQRSGDPDVRPPPRTPISARRPGQGTGAQ